MADTRQTCRWGILGTASIARKMTRAMHLSSHGDPIAIASRTIERANAFGDAHRIERRHASYEAVLEDPEIDAVYVPLPTALRDGWVIRAAESGKHVLCEKPAGVNLGAVEEMLEACRDAGVQFMDAVMFMHHDRLAALTTALPSLGSEVALLDTAFSFLADDAFLVENIRVDPGREPLGCVGDLGWYGARIALIAMGAMPVCVRARHHELVNQVPIHTTAELEFAGKNGPRLARIQCSFRHPLREWVEITGRDASIWMHDFVFGPPEGAFFERRSQSRLTDLDLEHLADVERTTVGSCIQEIRMIDRFSRIAIGLDPQEPDWSQWARQTQSVIDAMMVSAAAGGSDVAPLL